jgi:hypothetical protein
MRHKTVKEIRESEVLSPICIRCSLRFLLIFFAVALLCSSSVFAFGVAPSKQVVKFDKGFRYSGSFEVINDQGKALDILVYPKGEFEKFVKIDTQSFSMSSSDSSKSVSFSVEIPDSDLTPGDHVIELVAVGQSKNPAGSGPTVHADIAAVSQVIIQVPYPEKFIEGKLYVPDGKAGERLQMSLALFNKGSEDVDGVSAFIDIFDASGKMIATVSTDDISIGAGDSSKLEAFYDGALEEGSYSAVARILYDSIDASASADFNVGEVSLDIKSLVVNDFRLGDVAKFDILLFNNWNKPLKDVYAQMIISDDKGKEFTNFKTVATDIDAKSLGRLEGYWYTQGVAVGIYTVKIRLFYDYKVTERMFTIEVYPDKIVTNPLELTGKAISTEEESAIKNNAFLMLIILALVAVIVMLVWRFRSKGDRGDRGSGGGGSGSNSRTRPVESAGMKSDLNSNTGTSGDRTDSGNLEDFD